MARTKERIRVALLAVTVLLTGGFAACGSEAATPGAPPPSTSTISGSSTRSPSLPPPASSAPAVGQPRALAVYYVSDTPAGFRLYREFHRVTTADPASDAVREMLARPTGTDPDYRTLWPAGTALRAPVTRGDGVITVDLTREALSPASLGSEAAQLTVQQLVFTVQAALQETDPVRLLVDGERVPQLWGAVSTAEPVRRADQYAVRSLVQIDSPAHGARVGRTVRVSGEAAVFEANVPWEVLRDGVVVQSGFTTAAEGQRFAPYSFTVTLEPGDYVVRVTEDDPSGGEGRPVLSDDKAITVTG